MADDDRTLSEKVQDLLAQHYRGDGVMPTNFYCMVEGIDSDGDEFWTEAFTPGASIRRRLALVEWSSAVVKQDARSYVRSVSGDDDDD